MVAYMWLTQMKTSIFRLRIFRAQANGSYICNDLLGYDVSTPEGAQSAREDGLFTDFCPKMVASAVDILEEIIKEMENDGIAKH